MLGETEKSLELCRTVSLSKMGGKQSGNEFQSDGPETEKLLCP